jgi:predicted PurR-regulated permease PerM
VAGAALYAFYRVHQALIPFVLAAALAYIVNPIITYFEARGLRRSFLVVTGYLLAVLLGMAAYAGLKPLIRDEAERLGANAPVYLQQIQRLATIQQAKLSRSLPLPPKVTQRALESAVGTALEKLQDVPSHLLGLLPLLAHALLVPFIGFFFLLDGPDGFEGLIQAIPSRYVEQAIHLTSEIDTSLGNYLRGILIVAVAITAASFAGLFLLGVENAVAIATLSGVSSFVPYLGAVMGAVVGGGMAVYQFGTLRAGVQVVLLFVGIRLADEIFLQPVIAKHSVHLHPMVFLLALVLGGEMFGFIGLVFAIPAACIFKALLRVSWSWYASEQGLAAPVGLGSAIPYT